MLVIVDLTTFDIVNSIKNSSSLECIVRRLGVKYIHVVFQSQSICYYTLRFHHWCEVNSTTFNQTLNHIQRSATYEYASNFNEFATLTTKLESRFEASHGHTWIGEASIWANDGGVGALETPCQMGDGSQKESRREQIHSMDSPPYWGGLRAPSLFLPCVTSPACDSGPHAGTWAPCRATKAHPAGHGTRILSREGRDNRTWPLPSFGVDIWPRIHG